MASEIERSNVKAVVTKLCAITLLAYVVEELVCWQILIWVIETPGGQIRVV
jgi:hypothetical protein